jgi:hypothetical protein
MPDPEPKVVVTEKVREVHVGDAWAWQKAIRWAALVLISATVFGAGSCAVVEYFQAQTMEKIIKDPTIKIDIHEAPGRSPDKRFTREAK